MKKESREESNLVGEVCVTGETTGKKREESLSCGGMEEHTREEHEPCAGNEYKRGF